MSDTQLSDTNQAQNPAPVQAQNQPTPTSGTVFQFIKPDIIEEPKKEEEPSSVVPEPVSQSVTPEMPAGSSQKETEPLPSLDTTKWVEASEPEEVQLPPEASEAGVQSVSQAPVIPEEVKAAGVTYAPPIVPLAVVQEMNRVHLPMTEEEAKKIVTHSKASSSLYWLALTILRQVEWLKRNLHEKTV